MNPKIRFQPGDIVIAQYKFNQSTYKPSYVQAFWKDINDLERYILAFKIPNGTPVTVIGIHPHPEEVSYVLYPAKGIGLVYMSEFISLSQAKEEYSFPLCKDQ